VTSRAVALRSALQTFLILTTYASAHAQVIQAHAGTSTLHGATGGAIEWRGQDYQVSLGGGYLLGHFTLGGRLQRRVGPYTMTFGDDAVDLQLATDVFETSHHVPVRGVGVRSNRGRVRFHGLAGTTASPLGTTFFRGADSGHAAGVVFLDAPITPRLRGFSRTVIAERQTSINGMEWRLGGLKLAAAGGVGGNKPYLASSAQLDRQWLTAKAAYIGASREFRRVLIKAPLFSEPDGENLAVTLRPGTNWSLSAAHQNLLQPESLQGPDRRVTVEQVSGNLNIAGVRLSAGRFHSDSRGVRQQSTSVGAGRSVAGVADVTVNYFSTTSSTGWKSNSTVATFREKVSPRLGLLQFITYSEGQTSVHLGGEFLSNPVSVTVDHQTIYAPLRVGNPFVRAVGVNLRLQPFGSFALQVATHVTPAGEVHDPRPRDG
jgi:hypothetical protein